MSKNPWRGDSERHRQAALLGWQRRRKPGLYLSAAQKVEAEIRKLGKVKRKTEALDKKEMGLEYRK